jgi:hypothetical protein
MGEDVRAASVDTTRTGRRGEGAMALVSWRNTRGGVSAKGVRVKSELNLKTSRTETPASRHVNQAVHHRHGRLSCRRIGRRWTMAGCVPLLHSGRRTAKHRQSDARPEDGGKGRGKRMQPPVYDSARAGNVARCGRGSIADKNGRSSEVKKRFNLAVFMG